MSRVLVVDDSEQIRKMLGKILTQAGHEVRSAANAQEAIDLCAPPSYFDLIISDVAMPGVNGHELARWMAVQCPHSRVVLMSAFDPGCEDCPYLDNCIRLSKPFVPKEVVNLVSDALAKDASPRRIAVLPKESAKAETDQAELVRLRQSCSDSLEAFIAAARTTERLLQQFNVPVSEAAVSRLSAQRIDEAEAYDKYMLASMRLKDFLL